MPEFTDEFSKLVSKIGEIGREYHNNLILDNALSNSQYVKKNIGDLEIDKENFSDTGILISAGPSLFQRNTINRIKESNFNGVLIAIDASYVACLRNNLIPDYVLTLDPHPSRVIRWFGDPNFESNKKFDDYFERQDLDLKFRNNTTDTNNENIEIVNKYAKKTKLIACTSISDSLRKRVIEAGFDIYWWNPLVDNPTMSNSISKKLSKINKIPFFNTGGNVGTAGWVFASAILNLKQLALVGMDMGYYRSTDYSLTQTYYELIQNIGTKRGLDKYFPEFIFPLDNEKYYTDPTYYWYRENFLKLVRKSKIKTYNCTEGGTLFGEGIECAYLEDYIQKST